MQRNSAPTWNLRILRTTGRSYQIDGFDIMYNPGWPRSISSFAQWTRPSRNLVWPTPGTTHWGSNYIVDGPVDYIRQFKDLVDYPMDGHTTFYKQDEGNVLDAKDIHAGYEQLNKLFSQGGEIVIFYDRDLPKSQTPQNVTIGSWKSYRLKRRTVNTLSSETQSLVRGLGAVHWFRVLILESKGLHLSARDWHKAVAQLPFICVVDSKSLYDTVQKCVNPASQCEDKRTSIDIALIKEELSQLGGTIRWVGRQDYASR